MKFSNTIVFLGLLVGVVGLFFFLLFKPALREIKGLQMEIFLGQSRTRQDKSLSEELKEKRASVEALDMEVKMLRSRLLQPNQNDPLVNELSRLSSAFDFHKESISSTREDIRRRFSVTLVDVKLEGEFEDIYGFILGLEELKYAVQIDQLNLRSIRGEGTLMADITLSAARDSL